MRAGSRLLGLALLALSPALAAWALYVFRMSKSPEDHRYLHNLRELASECWRLARTGELFGNGQTQERVVPPQGAAERDCFAR